MNTPKPTKGRGGVLEDVLRDSVMWVWRRLVGKLVDLIGIGTLLRVHRRSVLYEYLPDLSIMTLYYERYSKSCLARFVLRCVGLNTR